MNENFEPNNQVNINNNLNGNTFNNNTNVNHSNVYTDTNVNSNNQTNGNINCASETNIKKANKKGLYIFLIVIVLVGIVVFFVYQMLFSKLSLKNFKESYDYDEFNTMKKIVKTSLLLDSDKTIWNINGYDFYQGNSVSYIPVKFGNNILIIKNGDISKTYNFKINQGESASKLLTDKEYIIPVEHIDFDGDGISNEIEKNKGLSTYSNDTDGDGIFDNVELVMKLDPRKKDDYNTSRKFTVYQDNSENYKHYLEVTGKGNIANTFLDTIELNVGLPSYFVQSDILSIVTSNTEKPDKMTVYFKKNYSWNTEKYSIYKFDESAGSLEEIKTNSNDKYLYADVSLFGCSYFVGKKENAPAGAYNNQIMILIDNSGSMFTKEYVTQKTNIASTNNKDEDYAHDVDFKRLSLMTSLVNRLGTEKYSYSVYAFTNSYCDIAVNSKDKSAIISGINSLKTECQNFNGTNVSGAIRKYASHFDANGYGKKYMIVLTDGQDTGLFSYKLYDSTLNNYLKKGINIITVGLSGFTDSEYLMNIAAKTNGKYLYASDANMLDTLIEIVESSIEEQKTIKMNDTEVNLIADSGFKVERDGFNFANFGSATSPGGVCYGFAHVTKQIYLNQLPQSEKEVAAGTFAKKLIGYTLTENNKKRLVKGNVYNIKLNNTYSTLLDDPASDPNYRTIGEDGIPYLSSKYKKLTENSGFSPFMKEVEDPIKLTINGTTKEYYKFESLGYINLIDAEVSDENKDDYQLLQLINRGWSLQTHELLKRTGMLFEKKLQTKHYDYEKQVKEMITELNSGSPAMLSVTSGNASHAILATNVYKTVDLEKYIIGIYDSNVPEKESKMYLERQVSYESLSGTSYYSLNFSSGDIKFFEMLYEN